MKQLIFTFAIVGFFVCASFAHASMSSTNFEIRWDTFSTGGSDTSSSSNYQLRDSLDASAGDTAESASYKVDSGYRAGVDDTFISFEVKAQNTSAGRVASSLSGTTVTADTSGISVNDLIVLIQDVGASQVSAIGRVTSLGATSITVDTWKTAGVSPVIDDVNDYVYPLTSSALSFGELSTSSVGLGVIAFETTSANDSGYVVQVFEDGELRTGSDSINDVSDGAVTSGSEEYGARSSDTSIVGTTFDTEDAAITSTPQSVATETAASFESRNFLTLKAAISTSTTAGSYAQSLSLIASGNF